MAEGTEVGTAYVSIVPSAAGFGNKLQQLVTGEANTAGQKAGQALGAGISGQAQSIAKNVGAVFAVVGTTRFLSGAVAEAEDAARVGRLTAAVIQSTGAAAGVTADQVERLANGLSRVAGVDDEVIQSAENVLLTFRSVGKQVFPDAIKAALDMSAALGTDLQGSVIQLGKALNDPVQGMTALRRVGVSFTEEQQAQIRVLQQSGDLLGAQRLILNELKSEFGGAAAAGATATDRLSVAFKNLEESLGTALLPAVNVAADGMTTLVGAFSDAPGPIRTVGTALFVAAGGVAAASLAIGLLGPKIRLARAELEGLGLAGTRASAGFALAGKAALTLAGTALAIGSADKISGVKSLDSQVAKLAATTDGKLNKAFHDTNNELRGWDLFQSIGLSKRHDEFKTFSEVLKEGNFALAQRIILSETDLDTRGRLQEAYDKAISQTRQFNTDQELSAQIINGTGEALDSTGDKVDEFAERWAGLRDDLEKTVASDWSQQFGSNLEQALNPMERFIGGFGANVDDLKAQVATAKTEVDKAAADVAKLSGTATAAEISRLRGQAGDLDSARSRAEEATRKWKDLTTQLAEAQKSPLTQLRQNLDANLKAVTDWERDLEAVAGKLGGDAGRDLAHQLGALGPEAAAAVHEALGLSPKALSDLEAKFAERDKIVGDAVSGEFELNVDKVAKPGETLAEILADRYHDSLVPKLTAATLDALDQATTAILNAQQAGPVAAAHATREEREASLGFTGLTGPAAAPPLLGPPAPAPAPLLPPGPPLAPAPPGGITFQNGAIQVTPITNADPRQIAVETGDHLAWRLGPTQAAL